MQVQELIDYLTAQVKKNPSVSFMDVVIREEDTICGPAYITISSSIFGVIKDEAMYYEYDECYDEETEEYETVSFHDCDKLILV